MSADDPARVNLARVLVLFARFKSCSSCGGRTLYVNAEANSDGDFLCGLCEVRQQAFAKACRKAAPSKGSGLPRWRARCDGSGPPSRCPSAWQQAI